MAKLLFCLARISNDSGISFVRGWFFVSSFLSASASLAGFFFSILVLRMP